MNRVYREIDSVGHLIMRVAELRCPYCGKDVYWKATPVLSLHLPMPLEIGFCDFRCLHDYLNGHLPPHRSM